MAGRPKKQKGKTETVQVDLKAIVDVKNEIIADLEKRLDDAYKDQEAMLDELSKWLNQFPYAFRQLEEHAGKITYEDVVYHTKLVQNIMENKFRYKSKTSEE